MGLLQKLCEERHSHPFNAFCNKTPCESKGRLLLLGFPNVLGDVLLTHALTDPGRMGLRAFPSADIDKARMALAFRPLRLKISNNLIMCNAIPLGLKVLACNLLTILAYQQGLSYYLQINIRQDGGDHEEEAEGGGRRL